jgi:hypothetical protein
MHKILVAAVVLVIAFAGVLGFLLWSDTGPVNRPALAPVPPLPNLTRSSTVVLPVAIALDAIRERLEGIAPTTATGKKEVNLGQVLSNAEAAWTINRGPLTVAGRPEGLTVGMPVDGTVRLTGELLDQGGGLGGALGGFLSSELGRQLQRLAGSALDQGAQIRGSIQVAAQPAITPDWRLQPNLTGRVALSDASINVVGARLNIANEVRPFLERSVQERVTELQERVRADPTVERAARAEWARLCRAVPLGAAGAGLPNLWLELRPTRAFAAQPRADANALVLTVGVQAETRIVASETRPDCPFPAALELVQPIAQGRLSVAVPIDVPFTEVNRLVEAQLKGKTFPEDGSGAFEVTVNNAGIAPSGDRVLISLRVKARERKSFLGLGADADVYVWGRPVLDRDQQTLRLTDMALDVQSEAAFGLLGTAARAAMPYLEGALKENAVIDLKPFAGRVRQSIAAALADFRKQDDGVAVEAEVTDIRLTDIAFDDKTLRVIAEAQGTARAAVARLR